MLRPFILRKIAAFERRYAYDMSYVREVLAADTSACMRLLKLHAFSAYCRDLTPDVWYAVKVVGTMAEDCGPCTQLVVKMAEEAGVSAATLRAVLGGDDASMSPDVRLGVAFARAAMAHDPAADALREVVVSRWGRRALVTIAFALASGRIYPTLKYALGHGRSCSRVEVAGSPLVIKPHAASATGGALA